MKKSMTLIALMVFFVAGLTGNALAQNKEGINWMTFEEALAAQKTNPKPIMMDIYTSWCGPCKMMMKNTFSDKKVIEYVNANYYAVKFNGEGNEEVTWNGAKFGNAGYDPARANSRNNAHDLTRKLGIRGYPTVVIFSTDGNYLRQDAGYRTPDQLLPLLEQVLPDSTK